MKKIIIDNKLFVVRIDKSLDKYNDVVLFPEKLAEANKNLEKWGLPKVRKGR